jgi:hypothetical protein
MLKQLLPTVLTMALLTGCAAAPDAAASAPPGTAVSAFGAANVVSASQTETLSFALVSDQRGDTRLADDGTELAAYSYTIPVLQATTQDGEVLRSAATAEEKDALIVADAFNENFTNWLQSTDFSEIFSLAQADYADSQGSGQDWVSYYNEEFTYTSWRTDRLISIAGEYYSYTGGAHPNTVQLGWNFDLQTGRFLHPTALGADSELFQTLVTSAIIGLADQRAAAEGIPPDEMYWENYRDIAQQWPEYAVSFSQAGMTVIFPAYELAGYAAGPQEFVLDFAFLRPYLSEDGMALLALPEDAE